MIPKTKIHKLIKCPCCRAHFVSTHGVNQHLKKSHPEEKIITEIKKTRVCVVTSLRVFALKVQ